MKICEREASVEVGAIVFPIADRREAVALSHIGAASHPYNALGRTAILMALAFNLKECPFRLTLWASFVAVLSRAVRTAPVKLCEKQKYRRFRRKGFHKSRHA